MRITTTIILAWLAPTLTACGLFGDLKQEPDLDAEVEGACEAYCGFVIDAAEDCLSEWFGCSMDDWDSNFADCNGDCLDLRESLADNRLWKAVDCMWCVVDQIGDEASCAELEGVGTGAICAEECDKVDDLAEYFYWINDFYDHSEWYCS